MASLTRLDESDKLSGGRQRSGAGLSIGANRSAEADAQQASPIETRPYSEKPGADAQV